MAIGRLKHMKNSLITIIILIILIIGSCNFTLSEEEKQDNLRKNLEDFKTINKNLNEKISYRLQSQLNDCEKLYLGIITEDEYYEIKEQEKKEAQEKLFKEAERKEQEEYEEFLRLKEKYEQSE